MPTTPRDASRSARALVTAHLHRDTDLAHHLAATDPDPAATAVAVARMMATLIRLVATDKHRDPVGWWRDLAWRISNREATNGT